MTKHWIKSDNITYCYGPDNEMPADATEVVKPPYSYSRWDGNQWVTDVACQKLMLKGMIDVELNRLQKFLLLPVLSQSEIQSDLDTYIAALKAVYANPPADLAMPPVPVSLEDAAFYA